MTHRDGDGDWRMRPARPAEGGGDDGDVRIVTRMGPHRVLVTDALFISAEELAAEGERIGQIADLAGRKDGSLGAAIAARQRAQLQRHRDRLAARRAS